LPFLKNLPGKLEYIKINKFYRSQCQTINFYAQDESRYGLLSIQRRCLTAKGIKPIVSYQHRFKNFYLFGAYSPIDGDHFTLEFPYCNGDCFEQYLEALSAHRPSEFKILLLDNGAFHKAKDLIVPNNIELLFLPPYCPELNPAEKMWRHLKDKLANIIFDSLEKLSDRVCQLVRELVPETILSITGWGLYKNCLN
jgi:transposase